MKLGLHYYHKYSIVANWKSIHIFFVMTFLIRGLAHNLQSKGGSTCMRIQKPFKGVD